MPYLMAINPSKTKTSLRIGEVLVSQGLLSESDVQKVLLEQQSSKRPFGIIAEKMHRVSIEAIEEAWACQYAHNGLNIDLCAYCPRQDAMLLISSRQAWQFRCLPMNLEGDTLVIATTQKHLHRALKFATRVLDRPSYFVFTTEVGLSEALSKYYPLLGMDSALARGDNTVKKFMSKLRMQRIRKAS